MLEIDGSLMEGGGAVLRVSAALSAVTGKPVRIFNIRKGRPQPGLRNQHLEGLKALAELCRAELKGAREGSTGIEFVPGKMRPGKFSITLSTAGSIGLVFQVLKLPACMAGGKTEIHIQGGATFGRFAPPVPYTQNVLLPVLEKMGCRAEIEVLRHGFFPRGGARVRMSFQPCSEFKPLTLRRKGTPEVKGVSIASFHLRKARVAERQSSSAKEFLLKNLGAEPQIESQYVDADCPGSGLVLWTPEGGVGADSLGERGKPAERVGKEAAESLTRTIQSGASVDEHLSDQILLFMALANGKSSVTAPRLTGHTRTNIEIIRKFLPAKFSLTEKGNLFRIECQGFSPSRK